MTAARAILVVVQATLAAVLLSLSALAALSIVWDPTIGARLVLASGASIQVSLLAVAFALTRGPAPLAARFALHPVPARAFVAGVLGMYGLSSALWAVLELLGLGDAGALGEVRAVLVQSSPFERILYLPIVAIGAGFAEEVFFRAFALRALSGPLSERAAVVISALAFAALHADPIHSTAAFAMGLYLGVLFTRTGSALLTAVAHAVNNALFVLFAEDEATRPLASVVALVVGALVAALALRDLARRFPNRPASTTPAP